MKAKSNVSADDMRAEYDFDYSKAVRGRYYRRLLKEGANVVVLDPDVAKAFRNSAAVNEALRSLLRMSEATRRLTSRSGGRVATAAAKRDVGRAFGCTEVKDGVKSHPGGKVRYAFRRPRFPIICAVGNELLTALSPAAFSANWNAWSLRAPRRSTWWTRPARAGPSIQT